MRYVRFVWLIVIVCTVYLTLMTMVAAPLINARDTLLNYAGFAAGMLSSAALFEALYLIKKKFTTNTKGEN